MKTRTVSLTATLDDFVEQQVASGAYRNADEVVNAGLLLLQRRANRDAARRLRLRTTIQVGLDDSGGRVRR